VRYVILGAGAVGSVIGGQLFQYGFDVTLVARGSHLAALQADGLTLVAPSGSVTLPIPAVGEIADAGLAPGDRVILGVKSQDTMTALTALRAARVDALAVLCGQNGIENERQALRLFPDVYGICVILPATQLDPGVVEVNGVPHPGILDLGRYPGGIDDTAVSVASDLEAAGFSSRPDARIMRLKHTKLLNNLINAVEAAVGAYPATKAAQPVVDAAREEAEDCFRAAGFEWTTREEDDARRDGVMRLAPVEGRRRPGGSTWQSLARGTGRVEVDALNGEIVLLGRLHGVATPANELLQHLATDMAASGAEPGTVDAEALIGMFEDWRSRGGPASSPPPGDATA
jgi:2-dehydropantoate 2-reductase